MDKRLSLDCLLSVATEVVEAADLEGDSVEGVAVGFAASGVVAGAGCGVVPSIAEATLLETF